MITFRHRHRRPHRMFWTNRVAPAPVRISKMNSFAIVLGENANVFL
jgi:hypothetical protein